MFKFLKKIFLLNKKKSSLKADEDQKDFSIELFQLENLINNQVSFLFFNLSPYFSVKDCENFASSILKLSQAGTEPEIKEKLKQTDKSTPIVLICERGDQSRDLTQSLQKEGFINVFFVVGGIMSLITVVR